MVGLYTDLSACILSNVSQCVLKMLFVLKCCDSPLEMMLLGFAANKLYRSGFKHSKAKIKMSVLHKPVSSDYLAQATF